MPITQAKAREVATAFVRDYPGAGELAYKFCEDVAALYGLRAGELPKNFKGGYLPRPVEHEGRLYKGRVDVPLAKVIDANDLLDTLRHEVLGHYGANTFTPADKRALLDGLAAARNEPTLKPLWDNADRRYADQSLDMRAEEIFAQHCEGIEPSQHQVAVQARQRGQQSFVETCIARARLMQADDLDHIACMVAQGLRDRSRTQQTFPEISGFSRKDEAMEVAEPDAVRRSDPARDPARIIEPFSESSRRMLDSLAVHAALPHLAAAAGGLEALRAAGEGKPLGDAQRQALRGAFPDALIERHCDRFSRLGELAYMNVTRRQAAVERQSPGLSPAERAARSQQWQVAPQLQQRQLQSRNIAQREEEQDRQERLKLARNEIRRERQQEHAQERTREQVRHLPRDRDSLAL